MKLGFKTLKAIGKVWEKASSKPFEHKLKRIVKVYETVRGMNEDQLFTDPLRTDLMMAVKDIETLVEIYKENN